MRGIPRTGGRSPLKARGVEEQEAVTKVAAQATREKEAAAAEAKAELKPAPAPATAGDFAEAMALVETLEEEAKGKDERV